MWDVETHRKWLKKGHRLFLFKPKDKIKGWMWVTTRKEFGCLYINPNYRNVENARDLKNISRLYNIKTMDGNGGDTLMIGISELG